MRLARSDGARLESIETVETPQSFDEAMQIITDFVATTSNISLACGGFPGNITKNGSVLYAPNLAPWVGKPLKTKLEEIVGSPVHLHNDAAFAGLGEATRGAGQGYRIVAYITVSTGVGGARIVDHTIDPVSVGSEPGHQIVSLGDGDHTLYLEQLIGGRNIKAKFGVAPEDLTNEHFWKQFATYLAAALYNVSVCWSPDIIVIGGGIGVSERFPLSAVRQKLSEFMKIFPSPPKVVRSELGDTAGLYGALYFANSVSTQIKN